MYMSPLIYEYGYQLQGGAHRKKEDMIQTSSLLKKNLS